MTYVQKVTKSAIQLVSTTDFDNQDVAIANERFCNLKKSFTEYGMSIPPNVHSDLDSTHCILLGQMPDLIKLSLKVRANFNYFALVEHNREHRFDVAFHYWEWRYENSILIPREHLYEEVMEFIADYT